MAILSLHLIEVCLVYLNTLLIQEALSNPNRTYDLKENDLRALSPLIYGHINPYGIVSLDMKKRILIHQEK